MIAGGSLLLAAPVALAAGLLSFASPCVLPLVPGYLGYVGGMDGGERRRGRLVLGAALFVLGFSVVFVGTSIAFASVGYLLLPWQSLVTRVAGAIVVLLGLAFIGAVGPLQRRVAPTWRPRVGLIGAPLLGAVFGIGWTPCAGPMLGAIQALAVTSGSLPTAVALAVLYSVGLGLPFVLVALGFGWVTGAVGVLRRHIRVVNLAGGALLVLVGLLMLSGLWDVWLRSLQALLVGYVAPI